MRLTFREATPRDVPVVVALLTDDVLGHARETATEDDYLRAFDQMSDEPQNHLIVGENQEGEIVATYQITFVSGLSLAATRRAQIESVRIASHLRGHGLGAQMLADAEARARLAGCGLLQLTMNTNREDAHRFYISQGFEATHTGFKRRLD